MYALILLVPLFIFFVLWRRGVSKNDPPLCPGLLPLIGHAYQLIGNNEHLSTFLRKLCKISEEKGGVALFYIGLGKYYLITDPDDYLTAGNQCLQKHFIYKFFKEWAGEGLVTGLDMSIWRRHRKLLNPAFKQQVLDGFLKIFNQQAKKLVQNVAEKVGTGPFNHTVYLMYSGLETVCQTSLDFEEIDDLFDRTAYMKLISNVLRIVIMRAKTLWMQSDFIFNNTKHKVELENYVADLNKICDKVVEKKKAMLAKNGFKEKKNKTFLELISEYSANGTFTKQEVYDEVNTMIAAGYETTATCTVYVLMCIGTYPHVQDKLYEEIKEVFGDCKSDVVNSDISKLVYMEAVIRESLRIYTIVPVILRTVETDVKLKNYTMKAGSSCCILTQGLHFHPSWGDDVNEFKPERWLDPASIANPDHAIYKAFAGFGLGKRTCLGKYYSLMSMKTTLVHFLRHYRITADITQVQFTMEGILKPKSGDEISIELR